MHDGALLQALLDAPGLRPHEREAFRSMAARRADGRALSFGQRSWARVAAAPGDGARLTAVPVRDEA